LEAWGIWIEDDNGRCCNNCSHRIFQCVTLCIYQFLALRALGSEDLLGSRLLRWKHPSLGTPWGAILINSIGTGAFSLLSFEVLVIVSNIIYACILLVVYATVIRLRYTHKDMKRPFRITNSNWSTLLVITPPCVIACFLIVSCSYQAPIQLAVVGAIFVVSSLLYLCLYYFRQRNKKRYTALANSDVPSVQRTDSAIQP